MSVTSRAPAATKRATSSTTSRHGRDTSRPRVAGTTQKAQWLSQPFWMVTSAVTGTWPGRGSAERKR